MDFGIYVLLNHFDLIGNGPDSDFVIPDFANNYCETLATINNLRFKIVCGLF
jgi:hypothetical protein